MWTRYPSGSYHLLEFTGGWHIPVRLLRVPGIVGGYGYDANANMTQDGVNALTYDAVNHLISSSGIGGSATYSLDGNGLRAKRAVSGGTSTVYIFSGSQVIAGYETSLLQQGGNPNQLHFPCP